MLKPAPMTLAYATEQLAQWHKALEATSSGQSYSIGGRTLTRQDVQTVRDEIQRWHNTVTALQARQQGNVRPLGAQVTFPAPGKGAGGIIPVELWTDPRT